MWSMPGKILKTAIKKDLITQVRRDERGSVVTYEGIPINHKHPTGNINGISTCCWLPRLSAEADRLAFFPNSHLDLPAMGGAVLLLLAEDEEGWLWGLREEL